MKVTIDLSDWAVQDIKRLIAEATADDDGKVPVVGKGTWPQWIGAACVHLASMLEDIKPQEKQS